MNLLDDDSDTDLKFTINKSYAKKYDKWRQGEELQKLKDRYGDNADSESSSSEEEEDEDGKEWTEDIEKDFLKTLSSLKEKNPKIYDKNVRFFDENPINSDENKDKKKKKKKEKSDKFYSVADYQRDVLLENQGKLSDEEEEETNLKSLTNAEEEKVLKNSFKKIMDQSDSENEEVGWGALFKKRIKTEEELKNEDEDYKLWLAGEKKKLENKEEEKELKGLHDFWTDPNLDEGEQFLRDYILNKRFLEKNNSSRIPSYDEIVHDSDSDLSADGNTLEKQEDFERKYNFRFEEPDHEFVKRFPRTMEHSMRKKDERRKKHREEVKIRKQTEKTRKSEELKRLKSLKKKEIMDRIKKLQEITGNEGMGFQANDLEDEFNPEEHDRRMSELFNDNYYGTCSDEQKPEYPELDEELEIENWDEWEGEQNEERELHCEDPGFNMDCDYDPASKTSLEPVKSSRKGNKRRRSKFAAAVAREKPLFDPENKTFEKYVDEYYSLDYEDLIGDMPCRFKYRKVVPNDFGLSVEEILAAPDKELNSWVSVKKILQRRPENVELFDVQAYRKKAKNAIKKQKCLPSLYNNEVEHQEPDTDNCNYKPRKNFDKNLKRMNEEKSVPSGNHQDRNRPRKRVKSLMNDHNGKKKKKTTNETDLNSSKLHWDKSRKDKKGKKESFRKNRHDDGNNVVFNMSDTRLKSYGLNPKKIKNKLKFGTEKCK